MKHPINLTAVAAIALCLCGKAFASTAVDVPATGDLYLSGQPSGTICCYMDSAPAESPVLAPTALIPGEYLTFSATGEAAYQPGPAYATPDGDTAETYNLQADYGTGV